MARGSYGVRGNQALLAEAEQQRAEECLRVVERVEHWLRLRAQYAGENPQRLARGQRVRTPLGGGVVDYVRLAPPRYRDVEAACVVLDARAEQSGYIGTVFSVSQITNEGEGT
jgi:hypothetical protein